MADFHRDIVNWPDGACRTVPADVETAQTRINQEVVRERLSGDTFTMLGSLILVLSQDRLSCKYANQVLLLDEFAHRIVVCGFVESPAAENAAGESARSAMGTNRRVRTGANRGALAARLTAQGHERVAERAVSSALRVPLRKAERRDRSALRRFAGRTGSGARGVRPVCGAHCITERSPAVKRSSEFDVDQQEVLGPLGDMGHAVRSGLLRGPFTARLGRLQSPGQAALAAAREVREPPDGRRQGSARILDRDPCAALGERVAVRLIQGAA